jgi:tetratricopeptide (TPR) repeat protein
MLWKRAIEILLMVPILVSAAVYNRDSLQVKLYTTNEQEQKVILLNLLSESWINEDLNKANQLAKEALWLAESARYIDGKAESLYNIAVCSYLQNDYITASNLLTQSISGFKETDNSLGLAKASLALGKVHARQFDHEKSIEQYIFASEIFQKYNKYQKLAECYNCIGGIYYDQSNYDKAFEYYRKSQKWWEMANDTSGLAIAFNNIGEIYRLRGQFEEAMQYYRKSTPIFKATGQLDNLALCYDNIANILIGFGIYDSARYYLDEALRICKLKKSDFVASYVYLNYGKLFKATGFPDISKMYYDSSYRAAIQTGVLTNMRDAAFWMSEISKEKSEFKDAYYFHQIFKRLGDSVMNMKNLEKITQLEMKLIFEQDKKIKEQSQERTRYIYFLIAVILISLLIVSMLLYGRLRIKNKHARIVRDNLLLESQQLQTEIDYKNRELATNVLYLVKKNELINLISEKLLKAKPRFTPEIQPMIQKIILDLQANVDSDIWKSFEQRFIVVQKDFYEKLNQRFPNLTENERKLCALLRLKMSTKDIAAITHQNLNAIEVARTRLRKKLNLSNQNINLVTFLDNL